MWVRTLNSSECFGVLAANRFAHLACARDGRPYVVPIYYAYSEKALYAFSLLGKKVECMRANPLVSALVEAQMPKRGWISAIADGRYEELPERIGFKRQRDHAWSLLSKHASWWEPGALKPASVPLANEGQHVFFRIVIEEVSGREARGEQG